GRVREAATTGVGLYPSLDSGRDLVGLALLGLLALAALSSAARRDPGPAIVAGAGAVVLYAIRFADGPGFVPGLTAATPLAREGGGFYARKRFLTAVTRDDELAAAGVVRRAGFDEFGLVTLGDGRPAAIPGFRAGGTSRIRLFSGVDLRVIRYTATG